MADDLVVKVRIEGAREVLRAFNRLPKEANKALRERSMELSRALAAKVKAAAKARGSQAALMAPTVRARRDRLPSVQAGGSRKVGRYRRPAWQLLFASEFGMNKRTGWYAHKRYDQSAGRQYDEHRGAHSYWFYKTVEENEHEIGQAWANVTADIVREFRSDT